MSVVVLSLSPHLLGSSPISALVVQYDPRAELALSAIVNFVTLNCFGNLAVTLQNVIGFYTKMIKLSSIFN